MIRSLIARIARRLGYVPELEFARARCEAESWRICVKVQFELIEELARLRA